MSDTNWAADFTTYACQKLEQGLSQILRCAKLLDPAEIWRRPNEHSNSIGNLILHLAGNVRQWIVANIGGEPFDRDRPAEFAERGPKPTSEITANLDNVVRRAMQVIARLQPQDLSLRRTIQGYDVTTLVAVFHVVEHFSYHAGQIIYATKAMKNVDLSLYDAQGRKFSGAEKTP